MLIKLYTNDKDIVIIENVTDVCIKEGLKEYRPWQPKEAFDSTQDAYEDLFFDSYGRSATPTKSEALVVREITYAKDGPKRLYVMKRAYVCNDEGKTIHVVDAGYDTVPI